MYDIYFYRDRNGKEPVKEYLQELQRKAQKGNKDARINLDKIGDYIEVLKIHGTYASAKFVDHLDGDIWELRPLRNRVLFAAWYNGSFILLHHFMKQTQKTPKREIEKAKRNLADIREREGGRHEKK